MGNAPARADRRWRTARVFVSSTFRDMQAERQALVRVVFPALRERLALYRVHLVDVDLRWGVTRAEAENDGALDFCLNQVEACRPFFIGILGQRYGWRLQKIPPRVLRRWPWLPDYAGRSITELEMIHGALQSTSSGSRACFYFRDAPDANLFDERARSTYFDADEPLRLLADLKDRIRAHDVPLLDGYRCRWEPGAGTDGDGDSGRLLLDDEFAARVERDLWTGLRDHLGIDENAVEEPDAAATDDAVQAANEADDYERFVESRLQVYVGRSEIHRQLLEFVVGPSTTPLALTGPPGSGKSAVLARLVRAQQDEGRAVVSHFVGASARSTSLRLMLRRICLHLAGIVGATERVPDATRDLIDLLRVLVTRVPDDAGVLFVIDAIDQLETIDRPHELTWLPGKLPPSVKFVISCAEGSERGRTAMERIRARGLPITAVPRLTTRERLGIVQRAPALWAKTLDHDQRKALLRNSTTDNPLFLLVAIEELRGFGSYERLSARIDALPSGNDPVPALFEQVLERIEKDCGAELPTSILRSIAVARRGISEHELRGALALDEPGPANVVLRQLRPYLAQRGALMSFFHRGLADAVGRRYLSTSDDRRAAHQAMAAFFAAMPDRIAGSRIPNARRADELPWQLAQAEQWHTLSALFFEPAFLEAKAEAGLVYDLLAEVSTTLRCASDAAIDPVLGLLNEALRVNAEFIARHPTALFQSVWNSAWWDGNPEATAHYDDRNGHDTAATPMNGTLRAFLQRWKDWKDASQPGHAWIRSLRPPREPLGSGNDLTIRPQADRLFTVTFSRDGQRVVCGGRDRSIGIYDTADGAELVRCYGHEHAVNGVVFSPDGQRIFSGSEDGTVRAWSAFAGDEIWCADTLQSTESFVKPPAREAVTAVIMRGLTVMGRNVPWTTGPSDRRVTTVACAGDGRGVAVAIGGNLMLLAPDNGALIQHLWFTDQLIDSLAWSEDGELIAIGVTDGTARLFEASTLEERRRWPGHKTLGSGFSVPAIAFDRSGALVASGDIEGMVRLWSVRDGALVWETKPNQLDPSGWHAIVSSLAFSSDSTRLVVGAANGSVRIVDARTGHDQGTRPLHSGWVRAVACSAAGDAAASCGDDRVLRFFSVTRTFEPPALTGHDGIVGRIRYSEDGTLLASATTRGDIIVWDALRCTPRTRMKDPSGFTGGLAWLEDGRRLAITSNVSDMRIFDSVTGEEVAHFAPSDRAAGTVIEASADSRLLASGSYDPSIFVHDAATGAALVCLEGYEVGFTVLSSTEADGGFVTGSTTGQVSIWNPVDGSLVRHLEGHLSAVTRCVATAAGQVLSAARDQTIRRWDIASGRQLFVKSGVTDITCLAASPDGRLVYSGSWAGELCAMTFDLTSVFTIEEGGPIRAIQYLPRAAHLVVARGSRLSFRATDGTLVTALSVCPDGQEIRAMAFFSDETHVLLLTSDSMLRLLNRETEQEVWAVSCDASAVVVSRDQRIALVSHSVVRVLKGQNPPIDLVGHAAGVTGLRFSTDGAHLITVSEDNSMKWWHASTGECLRTIRGPERIPSNLAFTVPYNRNVSSLRGEDGEPLDEPTGAVLKRIGGLASQQRALPFSPDGKLLACVSTSNDVLIVEFASGLVRRRLAGHSALINALAFSPDGCRVASGSRDKTVRVWDVATGEVLQVIDGRGDVCAIAAGAVAYPWLALVRSANETEWVFAETGTTVAWFPAPMLPIVTHPSGRMWCGVEYTKQFFLRLEGG